MAEATEALEALVLGVQEKTHPKIPNPHGLPLPRPGHLILRGIVHKEGHQNKSVKERITQLVVSFDNHVELHYAEIPEDKRIPSRWKNVVKISRGPGVQFNDCKNARGEWTHCLRIDLPMVTGAAPLPAYKFVMCFRNPKDRELWKDALTWAENRFVLVKQHDEFALADKEAARRELEEKQKKAMERRASLENQLAEARRIAEESRIRQEQLFQARGELLAETDSVKKAAAEERLRILQERDEFERNAEAERQRIIKEREAFESFEAQQKAEQDKLLSKQEELEKSLKPLKTFHEKDNVGGFVASAFKK